MIRYLSCVLLTIAMFSQYYEARGAASDVVALRKKCELVEGSLERALEADKETLKLMTADRDQAYSDLVRDLDAVKAKAEVDFAKADADAKRYRELPQSEDNERVARIASELADSASKRIYRVNREVVDMATSMVQLPVLPE